MLQVVWALLFNQALAQLHSVWLIGHEPLLQAAIARSEFLHLRQKAGSTTIESADASVRMIPCHTVTPAEIWAGKQALSPGEIIQKSLDKAVKLGIEAQIEGVFFTPFSLQALQAAGFWYDSLNALLCEWTRFAVAERIFSTPGGAQWVLYQPLPFRALAPFPVEYERLPADSRFTGADWMEMIRHGIILES